MGEIIPPSDIGINDAPVINPNDSTGSAKSDGFNLIQAIYSLIGQKPVGFSLLIKYKKELDLKAEHRYVYFVFLLLCMTIDVILFTFFVLIVITLLTLITIAFAKGIGIFDWFPSFLKSLR